MRVAHVFEIRTVFVGHARGKCRPRRLAEIGTCTVRPTGNPLMRGTLPQEGGSPSKGGLSPSKSFFFHFASRFTEERTKIAKSDNDVYEGSCVLSPCTNL